MTHPSGLYNRKKSLPVGEENKNHVLRLLADLLERASLSTNNAKNIGFIIRSKRNEPEKFVAVCELERVLDDKDLLHELAMNYKFHDKSTAPDSFITQFNKLAKDAYWNRMQNELSLKPPSYNMVIQLIRDIKQSFKSLLRGKNDRALYTVTLLLDEKQLMRGSTQVRNVAILNEFRRIITNLMGMVCCPARDEEIMKLKRETEPIAQLRGIMEVLEKMKYEMANYLLASTRPTIMHYSINYEREKFSEMRAAFGRKKFPNTMAWLKRTLSSINSTHSGVVVGDASCSKNFQIIKLIDIHMPEYFVEPYQELIQIEKRYPLPELLEIDAGRLVQLKEQMFRLCACAASMQITFKSVPSMVTHPRRQHLAAQLTIASTNFPVKYNQSEMLKNICSCVLASITEHSQESNGPLITENKKISLHAQIVSINCRTSAYSSVRVQLMAYLKNLLLIANRQHVSFPVKFQDYREQTIELARQFIILVTFNFSVYGSFYLKAVNEG
ncbi:T-complex protein 11-like protein 2 [Anopheles gambiae]|uniref:T-complex protein 11-like protein 2 n=1 Tax=Anopheles gambiae TaxID=7165 RepID=UPI002AC97C7D|nr:T-complex protein 11-like protein 2 [Anopheles gambiae]